MLLFSLGAFLVVITTIRLPVIIKDSSLQVSRTTWASVEVFIAAFVANAPTLYALRRELPEKPKDTEMGNGFSSRWSTTGDTINNYFSTGRKFHAAKKKQPKKIVLSRYNTSLNDRSRDSDIPPPVPPKDPLPVHRPSYIDIRASRLEQIPEETSREGSISKHLQQDPVEWSKSIDRHARIKNGKMEFVAEESTGEIDWDDVESLDLDIIIERYYEMMRD